MVRKIIWTQRAQKDRFYILEYWNKRNQSNKYSKKLNILVKKALILISEFPQIGKQTNRKHIRAKVLKDHLIIYEVTKTEVIILTFWDCRQNPDNLKKIINI